MFDDLAAYYYENIIMSFIEYRDISRNGIAGCSQDIRKAMVAASALFHFREHLPPEFALTRSNVEKRCNDYALLGDVVNAAKHKTINKPTKHGAPLVTDAKNLTEKLLIIKYSDDEGIYNCVQKSVVAVLADLTERNLLEVMTNVINFWECYLHSHGVLTEARTFSFEPLIRYRTRAECDQCRLDFKIIQGLRFVQTFQFLNFDNTSGTATPVDLTGCQLRSTIYTPRFNCVLVMKHKTSGKEFKTTVILNNEEKADLAILATDEERKKFVFGLPSYQDALRNLAEQLKAFHELK